MDKNIAGGNRIEARLRGHHFQFLTAAGMLSKRRIAASTQLLINAMEIRHGDRVLDFGCGYGVLGIVAARLASKGEVYLVDSDIRAVGLCQRNIELNDVRCAQVLFQDTLASLPIEALNVILCNLPLFGGKSLIFEMIEEGAVHLQKGGFFYLVGKRDKGILSYAKKMNEVFGNVEAVLKSGGYRVLRSVRSTLAVACFDRTAYQHTFTETLRGEEYRFTTVPGIFSNAEVDEGTELLIETMAIEPDDHVLDLGCGYGPIGVVAARLAPNGKVCLVDVNLRAVKAAQRNLILNGISHAQVLVSDGFSQVNSQEFDVTVTNPPFHSGSYVWDLFIQGAKTHLRPGGRMFLVAMRSEGYYRRMHAAFGHVDKVAERAGYTVLCSKT